MGVGAACAVAAAAAYLPVPTARAQEPTVVTVAAAGDIYGGTCATSPCSYDKTSDVVLGLNPTAALVLGDVSNVSGAAADYSGPINASWGRFKDRISPVPGNHDYVSPGAQNYYDYFGAAAHPFNGYYSVNLGAWHVIAINSNCTQVGGCQDGSPQETWLRNDLAADSASCTLAFWHHPRYSSGAYGDNTSMTDIWQDLYAAHADVVLSGHSHSYERFAPQDGASGLDAASGLTQFVVGTGGAPVSSFGTIKPNSMAHQNSTFGVLGMSLGPGWWSFRYQPVVGHIYADSGSAVCHGAPAGTATVPTAPTGITAANGDGRVDLSWTAPSGDGGSAVTRYVVYRSSTLGPRGTAIGTVTGTTYSDTTVANGTPYYYEVAAGNAVGDGPESGPVTGRPHGPPTVTLSGTPAAATNQTAATFSFTTSDPANLPVTTTCQVDAQPEAPCGSGQTYWPLGGGAHAFRVVARDSDGLTGTATYAWTVDTTAPTVVLTAPRRSFTLGPVGVTWSATDRGAGVASYTVRYRQGRSSERLSSWVTPLSWALVTGRGVTMNVRPGYTTCFSVRATDAAGNYSKWSASRCTATPTDDRGLVATGGWTRATGAAYYRQTVTTTRTAGATLYRRSVTASRLALVATKCARCGTVRVSFAGQTVATVRLYAARVQRQVVIALPRFARRSGRVVVQVVSSGRVVQVDGVGISRL